MPVFPHRRSATALAVVVLVLGALLTACRSGSTRHANRSTSSTSATSSALALLTTSQGVEAVSLPSGNLQYRVVGGVIAADGATVVATSGEQLVVRDARDGSVRRSIRVPAGLVVKALSGDATMAALSAPDPAPATPTGYMPAGRTATTIVVVDLKSGSVTRHDLAGSLTPEAFSTDNRSVFVISYLPAQAPDRYVVSNLDLASGAVDGVFGREKEPPEEMQGIGRTHTLAPDRQALYTLYLRPPTATAAGATTGPGTAAGTAAAGTAAAATTGATTVTAGPTTGDTRAEVHTLSLNGGWAHCIDLPEEFGNGDLSTASIAVSPEGGRLYVVDGAAHRVAEIDTNGLTVTRTASIAPSTTAGRTTVTAGSRASGRLFVGDGSGVQVLTYESLAPLSRWYTDSPVTALTTTASGGVVATTLDKVYVFGADGTARVTARPSGPSGDVVSINQLLPG
ncbi:MAG: hypothetical protein QOG44_1196 [Acidimicrobiaceae bacterium]|nr:hypothetical protein [Acidimicrobiaceae bacterium]